MNPHCWLPFMVYPLFQRRAFRMLKNYFRRHPKTARTAIIVVAAHAELRVVVAEAAAVVAEVAAAAAVEIE